MSNIASSHFQNTGTAGTALSRLFQALVRTDDGLVPVVLRITLAIVMFPHGAQKMLGWFGGEGFTHTVAGLSSWVGLPTPISVLVVLIEFFAPLLLLSGLLSRVAALGIGAVMVGAVAVAHAQHGFFMNWAGKQPGEGFEYHLLALGIVIAVLIQGSGALSVDCFLSRRS